MKTFHLLPNFSHLTLTVSKYEAAGLDFSVTICNIKYIVNLTKDATKILAIHFLQPNIPNKEITQNIF